MNGNRDINDHARADDVTAFIMRVAAACDLSGIMCVRSVRPAFEYDGEEFPAEVAYECRQRIGTRFAPQTLTFDGPFFYGCSEAESVDPIADELMAVFG